MKVFDKPLSVRLDKTIDSRLNSAAKRMKVRKSDLVRFAIDNFTRSLEPESGHDLSEFAKVHPHKQANKRDKSPNR